MKVSVTNGTSKFTISMQVPASQSLTLVHTHWKNRDRYAESIAKKVDRRQTQPSRSQWIFRRMLRNPTFILYNVLENSYFIICRTFYFTVQPLLRQHRMPVHLLCSVIMNCSQSQSQRIQSHITVLQCYRMTDAIRASRQTVGQPATQPSLSQWIFRRIWQNPTFILYNVLKNLYFIICRTLYFTVQALLTAERPVPGYLRYSVTLHNTSTFSITEVQMY